MRLADLWRTSQKPTLSFELFPPRTEKAAANLPAVIDELASLNPDFVSVTFGAGGSTREGSRQLVRKLQQEKQLEVVAYFAGYGLSPDDIKAVLKDYQSLGIESVLIVRGDIPKETEFEPHPESFDHASDLLRFIQPRFDFCLGAAGYPEGHVEAIDRDMDLGFLKLKVDLGAEYIIANYFYDNTYYFDFVARCRSKGIAVPILPGIMPVYSVKMMRILAGICGATITTELEQGLADLPADDSDALIEFGIDFATRQCLDLIRFGVPGIHIYTMDRSRSAVGVVGRLRDTGLI